ncbi:unnamed protein product [Prorocentrum cordatum]|uniref:Calmodulin-lysine N-methyltransferase n=1 Tax=Prorocentrum cordatum TaxID=2364126 RepID=A0ABN9UU85_9DINO|nr:unnamed protein product [Polarella glacialis]
MWLSRAFPAELAEGRAVVVRPHELDGSAAPGASPAAEGCLVPFMDTVLFDYGADRSNEDLMLCHGFAVPGNTFDRSGGLVMECEQAGEEAAELSRGVPALLVGPFSVGGPPWLGALPPRLLRALRRLLDARLQLLASSEAPDEAVLAAGAAGAPGAHRRHLALYRQGQRRALHSALQEVAELLRPGERASGSESEEEQIAKRRRHETSECSQGADHEAKRGGQTQGWNQRPCDGLRVEPISPAPPGEPQTACPSAVRAEGGAGAAEAPAPRRRVHRTRDGSTFVYDAAEKAWRLEASAEQLLVGGTPFAPPEAQFHAAFDGDFTIGGSPLLLGPWRLGARGTGAQEHGDTGRSIWDGAIAMAKALEQNPRLVAGRRVLELGSGRGVAGLAAALLGARQTVLTDLGYCLEALEEAARLTIEGVEQRGSPGNAGAGGPASTAVEVAELDWARPEQFLDSRPAGEQFDVLIAADVVWLAELAPLLARALLAVCQRSPSAEVLIVHQTRTTRADEAFLAAMSDASLRLVWALPSAGGGGTVPVVKADPAVVPVSWHPDYTPRDGFHFWAFRRSV